MLYWLQQLQLKRWCHRQTSIHARSPNKPPAGETWTGSTAFLISHVITWVGLLLDFHFLYADDFLPLLKSPGGLVGEEAASVPSQRTPLANVSLKHPLIEIQ